MTRISLATPTRLKLLWSSAYYGSNKTDRPWVNGDDLVESVLVRDSKGSKIELFPFEIHCMTKENHTYKNQPSSSIIALSKELRTLFSENWKGSCAKDG